MGLPYDDPINGNNGGAIWSSGNGPAADASGNIYVETGNGFFDGVNNFSDSVLKISPAGARVDYFTPFDQQIMQNNDIDLGSSNPIILPDSIGSVAHPHLLIAMGKVGLIYLLDQTNMGTFHSASNQDLQEVNVGFNTSSGDEWVLWTTGLLEREPLCDHRERFIEAVPHFQREHLCRLEFKLK